MRLFIIAFIGTFLFSGCLASSAPTYTPTPLSTKATDQVSTFYVSTGLGSDKNPGSKNLPWKTIQKAANSLTAGDTLIVQPGTYSERVKITRSGVSAAPITYQADGQVIMNGFTIKANYIVIKGFEITDTPDDFQEGVGIFVQGSYCDLEDNYIYFATRGGIRLNADPGNSTQTVNCIVRNNRLYRDSQWGILLMGQNHLIEGNEIWGTIQYHPKWINPPSTVDADGIRFFGSGHIIRDNYIHDISYLEPENVNPHIDCFQTWNSPSYEAGHDIIFEQNLCVNMESKGYYETGKGFTIENANNLLIMNNIIRGYFGIYAKNCSNLTIVNNTLAHDVRLYPGEFTTGVFLTMTPGSVIKNNIFYDFTGHYIDIQDVTSTQGFDVGNNLIFRNDGVQVPGSPYPNDLWNINPLFVNPTTGDLHLQPGSPAVDAGTVLPMVKDDFAGVLRPQGARYDIGAYEQPSNP